MRIQWWGGMLLMSLLGAELHAGETAVDLKLTTPAIAKIKARMAARAVKVAGFKNDGAAGEGAQGLLLQARPAPDMKLAGAKVLVDTLAAENDDRRALFRELALANQLGETSAVSAAYARAMRREALPGHLIQNPAHGSWVLKKDWRE